MSSQRYISDTLKQKKKKVKTIKFYLITVLLIAFCIGVLYLTTLPQIQISKVQVSGNTFVPKQEIEQHANDILNTNILWIIPKKNIFLFSTSELEKKLKENPAIVSVTIKKNFFDTLHISIVEQEKEMIYCTTPERVECFYINDTGFIYAQIRDFIIPEQEIVIYTENQTKKIQEHIIENETYINIVSFVKSSARYDIRIGEVYIQSDGRVEFVTRDGVRIITSIYDDFEKDFENMIALFENGVLVKEEMMLLDYIDLRFGNKVFYKNKTN